MRELILALALGVAALPPAAHAAQFHSLEVSRDAGRYRVQADLYLAAPPDAVYAVLTDYAHLTRISPSIRVSRLVQRLDADTALVYTDSRICALFLCRHIQGMQRFTRTAPWDLGAVTLPEQSNLKMGESKWHLEAEGEGTRMRMQLTLEPKFWIPPLIGPPLVQHSLRNEGLSAASGVERLARERAHLPPLGGAEDHEQAGQDHD